MLLLAMLLPVPPVITTRPTFRPIDVAGMRSAGMADEHFVVDVEVRGGSELLWSGPMRIATGQNASFNRQLQEAGD